jgi:hypothetical protein
VVAHTHVSKCIFLFFLFLCFVSNVVAHTHCSTVWYQFPYQGPWLSLCTYEAICCGPPPQKPTALLQYKNKRLSKDINNAAKDQSTTCMAFVFTDNHMQTAGNISLYKTCRLMLICMLFKHAGENKDLKKAVRLRENLGGL